MLRKSLLTLTALASLITANSAPAANPANDNGSSYQNPWGPDNPQSSATNSGFAPWVFDRWNPPTQSPAKIPFFIDTAVNHAWGINVPADINGQTGYDAAYRGFTGDGYLDSGQTLSTTVFFTVPGSYSPTETPTEGIDFFAQSPTVPSGSATGGNYGGFGHQVLGIYLGPSPSGPTFYLAVHNTLSDENAAVYTKIPIPGNVFSPTNTVNNFLKVNIAFKQLAGGNWTLSLIYYTYNTYTFTYQVWHHSAFGGWWWTPASFTYSFWYPNFITLTSGQYGTTWNTAPTEGVDAIRYFCSQGGATPGGPLEWSPMQVQ